MVSAMTKQAPTSKSIALSDLLPSERISTGIAGLDRVLGKDWRTGRYGVFVPSLVMLVGPNGIGKTTLMLQMATTIKAKKLLYITTDQTAQDIQDHAERVGMSENQAKAMAIELASEKQQIIRCIRKHDPQIVVVDAIDHIYTANGDTQAGMVGLVTALREESEKRHRTIFLVVPTSTKECIAAIQRTQNMASTVVNMKIDQIRENNTRVIGCQKNRFGDTQEEARFSMTNNGFVPADDETKELATQPAAAKDDRKHQVVIRIPSSLHEKLKRETESRQAASPGITITQSDVIRTILFESLR